MQTLFDVLGVPRLFHLPQGELERRFLALSKQLHPDRFAKAPQRERTRALLKTTELNDAYRLLKADVKRAEYLIKLEGIDLADEKSSSVKPDPELLMEMMELNERLDGGDREVLAHEVEARRAAAFSAVNDAFYAFETGDRSVIPEIAKSLMSVRYYARFLERVAGEEAL